MSLFTVESLQPLYPDLNEGQRRAVLMLTEEGNVFVTGGAGTGKSHLLRKYLAKTDTEKIPVLASTGAAAVLIGGRTFHSFFGLGIMEGGPEATLERAAKDKRLLRRLRKIRAFVLDEVSMIPGQVLRVAEQIASLARGGDEPWGGLKVIAVGDFAQLPPVSKVMASVSAGAKKPRPDWAFLDPVWEKTGFQSIQLKEIMRSQDVSFNEILGDVREGLVSERVKHLLEWRTCLEHDHDFEGSVLYAKKIDVERINLQKLATLEGPSKTYETSYGGEERFRVAMAAHAPVSKSIELRKNALVMIRQNDAVGRWVNGSLGHVVSMDRDVLEIRLMSGRVVEIEPMKFTMLDSEGNEIASARNFPVTLAYAITIHKAQGATLDRAIVSLQNLWEAGQAYVAMSRVRSSEGLLVSGWDEKSIFADHEVKIFHKNFS